MNLHHDSPTSASDSVSPPSYLDSLYSKCYHRQQELLAADAREKSLINIRLVGFLLLHWPSHAARRSLSLEVDSCLEQQVEVIGERNYTHLFRMFKSNRGPIPATSLDVSRRSYERKADFIASNLKEAPLDHQTAKKWQALIRDGFKCVVTSEYDAYVGNLVPEICEEIRPVGRRTTITECVHIFSKLANAKLTGPDTCGEKQSDAADVWTMIRSLGYDKIPEELNGNKIHKLENVMTIGVNCCWNLVRIPQTHTSYVASKEFFLYEYPETVTFKNHSELDLPLPSPTHLKIHAACARNAHLSGDAEHIERILREIEEMEVLAEDGASAEMLTHAILALDSRILVDSIGSTEKGGDSA